MIDLFIFIASVCLSVFLLVNRKVRKNISCSSVFGVGFDEQCLVDCKPPRHPLELEGLSVDLTTLIEVAKP